MVLALRGSMTNDEKRAAMAQAVQKIRTAMMLLGDRNPVVSAVIVDTDPAPMSGPYIQIAASCKFLLSDANIKK